MLSRKEREFIDAAVLISCPESEKGRRRKIFPKRERRIL
jgi:hypothetical protein